jgi:hypothetical protein
LIAATDEGLAAFAFSDAGVATVPSPLLATAFDSPCSMALLAGRDSNHFDLAVGCYGAIELVSVSMAGGATVTQSCDVSTGDLAYDPIHAGVLFVAPAPRGTFAYAMDEGGVGLIAVDRASAEAIPFPCENKGYGNVRGVVPSLDGDACLVTGRGGQLFCWSPGDDPRPVGIAAGNPIAWRGDRAALVMDRERAVLRETVLPF